MRYFFKKAITIITILLISVFVFFGYNYTIQRLKTFISAFSEENFNARLSIGNIKWTLPLCLELKDVQIGDALDIQSIRIYPSSATFLLKGRTIVAGIKIIEPVLRIKKLDDKEFTIPNFFKKKEKIVSSKTQKASFYFPKIYIHNGSLIYEDDREKIAELVRIKGYISNPRFYTSDDIMYHFVAEGLLKNKETEFLSPFKIKGNVKSDNVISAKLQASNINLYTLTRELKNVIKKGMVDLESDIQVSRDNIIARCSLQGKDIVLEKNEGQKIDMPLAADFILMFNFRNNMVKIKNLQGNFLDFIVGITQSGQNT